MNLIEVICYIGGAILFLGVAVLLWQHWEILPIAVRILVTAGSVVIAYTIGLLASRNNQAVTASSALYLIALLLFPVSVYVLLDSFGVKVHGFGHFSLITGLACSFSLLSLLLLHKDIFALFSIIYAAIFFLYFTNFMINPYPFFDSFNFLNYRLLVIGFSCIMLGFAYTAYKKPLGAHFLYAGGIGLSLSAGLLLGNWKPHQNKFWEAMFPIIVLAMVWLSVRLRNVAFLIFSTLFFMVYILKISFEYFAETVGWPVALIMAGATIIALGSFSLYLQRRYIKSPA